MWKTELGGHRNAVAPTWEYCRVCDLVAQANAAGAPKDNPEAFHLVLKATDKHR